MLAELFAFGLVRANLCAAVAILAVLAVRRPVRRRLGAQAAYALWAAVPAAAVASTFPSLDLLGDGALKPLVGEGAARVGLSPRLVEIGLAVWLAGVVGCAIRLLLADRRFRRAAAAGLAGPAVSGVLWPRIVTPADYGARFTPAEQALIAAHERAHIRRGDPMANLLLAGVQALAWCNPLVPLAAARMRLDQEIACDEAVLAARPDACPDARPDARGDYARALLKAQIVSQESGYGWAAFSGAHPLEDRLRALAHRPASERSALAGLAVAALPLAAVLCAWALAPAAFRSGDLLDGPRHPALLIDLTPRAPR